jgi:protoporphyrinogen oxidase
MPLGELVEALDAPVPSDVRAVARGLRHRDFLIVGLLLKSLEVHDARRGERQPARDHWIYLHEPAIRAARLQIFNNWSPWMVADPATTWIGVEYFCNRGDGLWSLDDRELQDLAARELASIGVIDPRLVLDGTVQRVENAYPAYCGSYARVVELRSYLDSIENLVPLGRGGLHQYNNMDHSMLTAMTAVDNLVSGRAAKAGIWEVNADEAYIEERRAPGAASGAGQETRLIGASRDAPGQHTAVPEGAPRGTRRARAGSA